MKNIWSNVDSTASRLWVMGLVSPGFTRRYSYSSAVGGFFIRLCASASLRRISYTGSTSTATSTSPKPCRPSMTSVEWRIKAFAFASRGADFSNFNMMFSA